MNQGDITGCGVCCETELEMCSLLWAANWEIWAGVLQALVTQAVTSASSCLGRDSNSTQQADPREGDAGERQGQTQHAGRWGHEPNEDNKRSLYEEQIYTIP